MKNVSKLLFWGMDPIQRDLLLVIAVALLIATGVITLVVAIAGQA